MPIIAPNCLQVVTLAVSDHWYGSMNTGLQPFFTINKKN